MAGRQALWRGARFVLTAAETDPARGSDGVSQRAADGALPGSSRRACDLGIQQAGQRFARAIAQHVHASLPAISARPRDDRRERVFDLLSTAWAENRKTKIGYLPARENGQLVSEREVSPYFLEPNPAGHTRYLIGHDSLSRQVRTFRVERIQPSRISITSTKSI
jgi:predicted DNA-binding transcriptional regulator YafY